MIYLTLDSDIWLNSLKESGEENNFIDSLEYWIENGHIKILLPGNIIDEWKRNRDKKKQTLVNDWKAFFNRAKKVFSPDAVKALMTPDNLNEMVEKQLERVEAIFDNYALEIPITNEYRLKATELAEQKKAPFGQKNSIGDAYIFLSITDYIFTNNLLNCVFVTNNYTDFSHKDDSSKIHPDLEPEFAKLKIGYEQVAKYIGVALNSIHFASYFATNDKKFTIELVVFLYENGQKEVADDFCNKMVKQGHEFFIELHNRYKD